MPLGAALLKKINARHPPSTRVEMRYGGQDLVLFTDDEGRAVQLFIGQLNEQGEIKGDRYRRNLVFDKEGRLVKDHWDRKGRTT